MQEKGAEQDGWRRGGSERRRRDDGRSRDEERRPRGELLKRVPT